MDGNRAGAVDDAPESAEGIPNSFPDRPDPMVASRTNKSQWEKRRDRSTVALFAIVIATIFAVWLAIDDMTAAGDVSVSSVRLAR